MVFLKILRSVVHSKNVLAKIYMLCSTILTTTIMRYLFHFCSRFLYMNHRQDEKKASINPITLTRMSTISEDYYGDNKFRD
jgi:thiamine transporter ThiT